SLKHGIWMMSFMAGETLADFPPCAARNRVPWGARAFGHTVAGYSCQNMDSATVTRTAPSDRPPRSRKATPGRPGRRRPVLGRGRDVVGPALLGLLALTLALRLWGIK